MTEASFTAEIMKADKMPVGVWEAKITKTGSLSLNALAPHQLHSLLVAKKRRFTHKIRDEGISKKPFDGFTVERSPAWVIAIFWKPGVRYFYAIDIDIWYHEVQTSTRRSLTEERANIIGTKIYLDDNKKRTVAS